MKDWTAEERWPGENHCGSCLWESGALRILTQGAWLAPSGAKARSLHPTWISSIFQATQPSLRLVLLDSNIQPDSTKPLVFSPLTLCHVAPQNIYVLLVFLGCDFAMWYVICEYWRFLKKWFIMNSIWVPANSATGLEPTSVARRILWHGKMIGSVFLCGSLESPLAEALTLQYLETWDILGFLSSQS